MEFVFFMTFPGLVIVLTLLAFVAAREPFAGQAEQAEGVRCHRAL